MYPLLKNCLVRGTEGDYYLQNYKTGMEYDLEDIHAQVLWHCFGRLSIQELSNKFTISEDEITEFLAVLVEANLVTYQSNESIVKFPNLANSPNLREVQLDATGKCNLYGKCKHCYGKEAFLKATRDEMNTEQITKAIKSMEEMNVSRCFLSGGEIMMRDDVPAIVGAISSAKIHLAGIFTNGTIYKQEVVDALIESGMNTVFLVSLDSHLGDVNNFMRGEGNYEKTISFIKKIKAAGFPVTINTMVIKQNVNELMEMCKFLEKLGIDRWRLSIPREQGETIANKDLIVPEWSDVFKAYEELVRYGLEDKTTMKLAISSIFKTELLREKVYYLFNEGNNCCEYKRESLVIKPDGGVVPCTAFDDLVFGNLSHNNLSNIWYSDLTQSFKTLPISLTDCKDCKIKNLCGGGCRKVALEVEKSIFAKDKNACPLYEFVQEVIEPIMKKAGIQPKYLKEPEDYRFNIDILKKVI